MTIIARPAKALVAARRRPLVWLSLALPATVGAAIAVAAAAAAKTLEDGRAGQWAASGNSALGSERLRQPLAACERWGRAESVENGQREPGKSIDRLQQARWQVIASQRRVSASALPTK